MLKRLVICAALAAVLPLWGLERPNIVFFVTDDQSPIAGCYGSPVIETPHLDALAAEGVLFTQAYATTASCSASRSVILTGLQNHANGQFGHTHDYHKFETFRSCAAVSLPLQLKSLGYRTAHQGKLHVAPEDVYRFDRHLPARGNHQAPAWVEAARGFIEEEGGPFFLCFWTIDPHRGNGEEASAPGRLKPNRFGNPPAGTTYEGIPERVYDSAGLPVPAFLPDTPECREELAQYYQSVTRTDLALGRLMALLKETGRLENTLVVFTADHGMAFPGAKTTVYEAGLHVPLVVRLPGGERAGTRVEAMVSHADLTPTLLDAAGGYDSEKRAPKVLLPVPAVGKGENLGKPVTGYHGRSWLPLARGEADGEGWDELGFSHTFHEIQMYYPMRAVRDRRYKLIWNLAAPLPYPFATDLWAASTWQAQYQKGLDAPYGERTVGSYIQRPVFELYDLEEDPTESRNLAEDPSRAELLAQMKERLKRFQRDTGDPWILKWNYE